MASEEKTEEMHAIVSGHVQGVFFRAETKKYAKQLGITGTVKNLSDGTVEIFAQGPRSQLKMLMEKLKSATGPGRVGEVKVNFSTPAQSFSSFDVLY